MALFGLAGILAAVLSAGCDSRPPAEPTDAFLRKLKLTDFAISGTATLLAIGQTAQLSAEVRSPSSLLSVTKNVTWSSADASIATVSAGGLVTAVAFGSTTATARLNDSTVTRRVDVIAATGLTVGGTVSQGNGFVSGGFVFANAGRTSQLTATATWPGGQTRTVTADTVWTSLDTAIASVSTGGLVRSNGFGTTTLVGKYQSLTVSIKVEVAAIFSSLSIQGNLSLNAPGDTSALTVLATFTDGIARNVSNEVTWTTSNASVATVSPGGVLTAVGFGQTSITVSYLGHPLTSTVSVSPFGTFAINGRTRDPGNGQGESLGVPGFTVRNLQTGLSTVTDGTGRYVLVGVVAGHRLRFEKDGWEPAELVITSPTAETSPAVQRVVRITAGATATIMTAPNDLRYELAPAIACSPCRLIRIVSPTAGTLHLRLTWTGSAGTRLSLWAAGQAFGASTTVPIATVADVPVSAGETIVYAGLIGGSAFSTNYMTLTLTTSVTAAPLGSDTRPFLKE